MRMSLHSCSAMRSLKLKPSLSYSLSNLCRSFLSLFSTVSSPTHASPENISVLDYLTTNFKFSEASTTFISKRLSRARSPQQPLYVLNFFKQMGLSEVHIQSMISRRPQLLFLHVDKILKPKSVYFQQLGFEGSDLGEFLSKNAILLTLSLNKTLVPSVETIRKIVDNEKHFIRVLHRYGDWMIPKHQTVLRNAAFFQSCGIIGSQLSLLLRRQPELFTAQESWPRNLVSRAVNLGFPTNSRMLVRAIMTIRCLSRETFERKLVLIQSCGFSEDETMQMFRKTPMLLGTSEKKLKFGIQVCLDKFMLPKSVLVNNPVILTYSMEGRVIPRWRVLQLLISKKLLKKNPSFLSMCVFREEKFLENYISKFRDHEEALLDAYKGCYLKDALT